MRVGVRMQKRTYAHFLCFLLGGFGGDFGGFEGEGGEVVCCGHGCGFAVYVLGFKGYQWR
jgi:hypothetical protein